MQCITQDPNRYVLCYSQNYIIIHFKYLFDYACTQTTVGVLKQTLKLTLFASKCIAINLILVFGYVLFLQTSLTQICKKMIAMGL